MQAFRNILSTWVLLLTLATVGVGQTRIDSLKSVLEKKQPGDTAYPKICLEICKAAANTNYDILIPEYASRGLKADTLARNIQTRFELLEYLGNYEWQTGALSQAAEQFDQMRLLGEINKNSQILANSYNGLGTVYYLMNEVDKSLTYYKKGLELAGTDTLLRIRFYHNIANSYSSLGKRDSVLPYYQKAVDYHLAHKNYRYLAITYGNMALHYAQENNNMQIQKYSDLALDAALKSGDLYQITSVYQNLAYLVLERHPEMAVKYYLKSLDLALKNQSYDKIIIAYDQLAFLAEKRKDYRGANEYLRKMKVLDDSLDLAQRKTRVEQIEFEHLAELKRIKEDTAVQKRALDEVRQQTRQRILVFALSAGLVALLVLLVLGYQVYRLRMKISNQRDRFFKMMAHDIKSPFSGILGLSELISEDSDRHPDPVFRKHAESLNKSLTHVYDLLDNLMQWSQAESGKVSFKPEFQIMSPVVDEVIQLHLASGKNKGLSIVNQIPFGFTARFDANMLHTILRNLLSNAIKFSPDNSVITISAITRGKEVVVSVSDQGIGMSADQIERIFKSDEPFSSAGTRNEKGTGLGLMLCKNFVTLHGGKIRVDSKPREGTTISFTLPD